MNDELKNNLRDPFEEVFSIPDKLENDESVVGLISASTENGSVVRKVNYTKKREQFYKKAQKTIESLFKFYLSEDVITNDEYIRQKAYHDQCTLGDLMNQIEITNRATTTIMENIDMGEVTPRLFEVLSGMIQSTMELLKMKTMHFVSMETNLKQLIDDKEIYQKKSLTNGDTVEEDAPITSRGSKKLMQQIQNAIKNDEVEDIDTN